MAIYWNKIQHYSAQNMHRLHNLFFTGMLYIWSVFLLLYPCRYMIYGLLLNYDSSTQAQVSFYTLQWNTHVAIIWLIHTTYVLQKNCRCKTRLPDSQKLWLSEWTYILHNFCRCKTCLPYNQKLQLPNWTYILQTSYVMQNVTHLVAIEGPWPI